jgi:transcriptional regulator with GAF, ATPase, and Fis domain
VDRPKAHRLADETTIDPAAPLPSAAKSSGTGRRFLAIYDIGRALLAQKEPAQVIRTIQDTIVEQLRPDHACLLAVDGEHMRPLSAHGLDLGGRPESWKLSHTVLARAIESGLAVLASDVQKDAGFQGSESIQRFRIRSVMCVPLGSRPVHGAIYLDNRGDERAFTPDDLEFVTAISMYAALVLERAEDHARTTQALERSDERLELLQGELLRHRIVGRSPALLSAYDMVKRLAQGGARVLLRGETGTGKELFARAYAAHSGRSGKPYVPVPIPALAPTLVESELFGHVRGAFTEATRDKKGRLEVAHGGVLFLDEVGDIELTLQAKLLRFLDSGELYRVGDTEPRRIDTRVVSATNRPIEKESERGTFRADLLARLGHVVRIPPLRERTEDIPVLIEHFLGAGGGEDGPRRKIFAPETLETLRRHDWPFNVRELQQVVERAICLVDGEVVLPAHLPDYIRRQAPAAAVAAVGAGEAPRPMREAIQELEKAQIQRALEYTSGNKRRAAELLQISADTFYKRLEEFGLQGGASAKD